MFKSIGFIVAYSLVSSACGDNQLRGSNNTARKDDAAHVGPQTQIPQSIEGPQAVEYTLPTVRECSPRHGFFDSIIGRPADPTVLTANSGVAVKLQNQSKEIILFDQDVTGYRTSIMQSGQITLRRDQPLPDGPYLIVVCDVSYPDCRSTSKMFDKGQVTNGAGKLQIVNGQATDVVLYLIYQENAGKSSVVNPECDENKSIFK